MQRSISIAASIAALFFPATVALAATLLKVDATKPAAAPLQGYIQQGASVSPAGVRIGINSRYLTRGGAPWYPVMGEFHYTRTAAAHWELELRKMKAAGITVVATYVFWNHHEEREGKFDWSERRDLRHFIELCKKVGLEMVLRVGPWAHGEARFGGVPDWVVYAMPTRGNDPQYMHYVERLYQQIGKQAKGLLWKDGGPIVAVQLENEYNLRGPGQGAEHISALKRLALKAGLDVPLYTVTGWDGAVYPQREVTPVFGGYVDEPWGVSTAELPPKETYAFRFDTRVSGDLGAQTAAHGPGTADQEIDKVPFFGAEYGPGVPFMYRRRPLIAAEDVAAMVATQIGSGVNLLGYYMFHGGRNPEGGAWLQESTGSGAYNDLPLINYDFQAPLGPDGQQRPVLNSLRPFHWFLQDFGTRLAPMTVHRPERLPSGPDDLKTPRFAVRSSGDSGFVFVNNHVRQYAMPDQNGVQFELALPGKTLTFPRTPVNLRNGDYFVWPFNLDMDGVLLRHATAQPLARIDQGAKGVVYVFAAQQHIPVELAFDAADASRVKAGSGTTSVQDGLLLVDGVAPGTGEAVVIERAKGGPVRVVVLSARQAEQLTVASVAGQRRLLLSEQQLVQGSEGLQLRSVGNPRFSVSVFPALARAPSADGASVAQSGDGLFQRFDVTLPMRTLTATVSPMRDAQPVPPLMKGGLAGAAQEPIPEAFKAAASWTVSVPRTQLTGLDDALLNIDFVGDIGRLYSGVRVLDDWYYSGYGWQFGLRQVEARLNQPLTVSVLPLRADAAVYIDKTARPDFGGKSQIAELRKVSVTPVYLLKLRL